MWSTLRRNDRARWLWCLLSLLLATACGRVVPAGGVVKSGTKPVVKRPTKIDAVELIPGDLDLVMRIDLAKMRDSLEPHETKSIAESAVGKTKLDGLLRQTLARASVAWLGLRIADLDAGDRVLVVELERGAKQIAPDPIAAVSW